MLPPRCYICSLSSLTVVYKGLLTPWQFPQFYEDLGDPLFATTFAVFHQRYSTNTSPSWHLAQPFRYSAHNGEINTIISNRRWIRAKGKELRAKLTVGAWYEILEDNVSDSASFDNAFEQKLLEGHSPEAAMLSMVPPAFENDPLLSRDVRGALASLSQDSEPWDGPAALVFSDGNFVGAKLDRNGLRPLRYTLTHDGLLIAGSETGLVDLPESRIAERQRLGPGEMILGESGDGHCVSLARNFEAAGNTAIAKFAAAGAAACGKSGSGSACQTSSSRSASLLQPAGPKINSKFCFQRCRTAKKPTGAWATTRRPHFCRRCRVRCGITANSVSRR